MSDATDTSAEAVERMAARLRRSRTALRARLVEIGDDA